MSPTPVPTYGRVETSWDTAEDAPGPRCGHTLTAVSATKSNGPRLILFGGATAIEIGFTTSASVPGIRLVGVTNAVHSYDVSTKKWIRIRTVGQPPSPRAAHVATSFGTMVVFQGGIGPAGHSPDDLYVLDLTNDSKIKWHRVVVQGLGPGLRYGHAMDLVGHRYLITVGGNDGKRVLSDAWVLDTAIKPYRWQKLNPEGDIPAARMYATAAAHPDGMLFLFGGRDSSGTALADSYWLCLNKDGQWEWTPAPGISSSPRYQHAAVFIGDRLHVTGGSLRGGWAMEGQSSIAVMDAAARVWLDSNGIIGSSPSDKSPLGFDTSLQLIRRCRHASASVEAQIYIFGGLRGDRLLDDLLFTENLHSQFGINSPISTSEETSTTSNSNFNQSNTDFKSPFEPPTSDGRPEITSPGALSVSRASIEKLVEASAAEAEAVSAVWQAAKTASSVPVNEALQLLKTSSDGSNANAPDVHLHPKAVVVANEAVGNLGALVRQLSLDQFENEGRRMSPLNAEQTYLTKKLFSRQKSSPGLHKKVISLLLKPRNWKAPTDRTFFLDPYEVGQLCYAAEQIFMQEPTVLQLKAPVKVFGDLHGQFGDLMRLFEEYGFPSTAGDITYIDYLFLGDYVDRGQHSLETITLLLSLKIEYPENFHLIRGNHEAADINALFGFRLECIERMGEINGMWAWTRFNLVFNFLPLAALIEKKIICMHGGIGRSINYVEQIEKLHRPISMESGSIILMDLLWSDPTENDSIEGLRPNARGPGLVTFGPDRVATFCKNNNLQLIIRAHECVMDGFERFAHGQLITLFSATNYCGTANNAGAILVIGRGLVVLPKLIHPLPPPVQKPEPISDHVEDATWMQELNNERPPTPIRGRPQPDHDRSSLAYI